MSKGSTSSSTRKICFSSLNDEKASKAIWRWRPSSLGALFFTWRTAMNLPPPGLVQTFFEASGIARSIIWMMLASVGMPAMLTCSSEGPMQVCMMGFVLVVTAFTLMMGRLEFRGPGVAGEFGHGFARMGVLVFFDAFAWKQLAFDDVFRMGDAALVDGQALRHVNGLSPEGPSDVELVVPKRRRGRLEAGCQFDGGIDADADRDGQGLAELLGLFQGLSRCSAPAPCRSRSRRRFAGKGDGW